MNRIDPIHVAPTPAPKTGSAGFGAALRDAAAGLARGVASTAALAAPLVPGGALLSVAARGAAALAGRNASPGAHAGGAGEQDLLEATRAMQAEARASNLQYLQLQEAMQRESRGFTAASNVLKVKHDSAKSAIANIH
jgi:hypothetical protein